MGTEKWIEENTKHTYDRGVRVWGEDFIDASSLELLLKTHAIVPREPSYKVIKVGISKSFVRAGTISSRTMDAYKAMIKAAEND